MIVRLRASMADRIDQPPNNRLKLTGLLLKESSGASPGGSQRGGPVPCARPHVARNLSAIR